MNGNILFVEGKFSPFKVDFEVEFVNVLVISFVYSVFPIVHQLRLEIL